VEIICCVVDGTPLPIIHTHNGDGTFQNFQTYCECVLVALGIHREMRLRRVVVCDLPGSTIIFHII